jgi:hypothetical protein
MAEERDVPELQDLVTEIETTITSLDERMRTAPPGSINAMAEITNTILPLLKDVVESVLISLVEIRDIADPIELTGADAQEIGTLLAAFRESQKDNPQLVERIDGALDLLGPEGEDDEDENEDEEDES